MRMNWVAVAVVGAIAVGLIAYKSTRPALPKSPSASTPAASLPILPVGAFTSVAAGKLAQRG